MIFVYDGHRAERPPGSCWLRNKIEATRKTADALRIISVEAANERYDLRSIHIPKTIDNDPAESDHAPGFPSAARIAGDVAVAHAGR